MTPEPPNSQQITSDDDRRIVTVGGRVVATYRPLTGTRWWEAHLVGPGDRYLYATTETDLRDMIDKQVGTPP